MTELSTPSWWLRAGGWLAMPPHVQELSVSLTDPGWQLSGDEQEVSVIKPVPAMQLA